MKSNNLVLTDDGKQLIALFKEDKKPAYDEMFRRLVATHPYVREFIRALNRTDLIADDRPYAAALLLSFGYNARKGDRLRTTQLRLGMVGPSAFGEQVQNR